MAKIKPVRRNGAKPTVADWSKAIPCLFILVLGAAVMSVLLYFAITTGVK